MGLEQMWAALKDEVSDIPDVDHLTRLAFRLVLAAILGGTIGFERKHAGKHAGPRTHMLVAVGSAVFVLIPQQAGMDLDGLSRVMQGLIAGIGFIGGGAILKAPEQGRIEGLTSAAAIWLVAAIGVAIGMGRVGSAVVVSIFAFVILSLLHRIEKRIAAAPPGGAGSDDKS